MRSSWRLSFDERASFRDIFRRFGSDTDPHNNHVERAAQADLPTNVETLRDFVRDLGVQPMSQEGFEAAGFQPGRMSAKGCSACFSTARQ